MKLSFLKPSMLAMVALLMVSIVQANPFEDAQIELQAIESGKKAIVKVWNIPSSRTASLTVLNAERKVVYKESFTSATYAKKFDFSKLPAGEYKLLLRSGTYVQSEIFEVLKNGSILVMDDAAIKNFKPIVMVREGKQVDVLLENRFAKALEITLKNKKGEVVYRAQINPDEKYGRRLNLNHLPKDNYALNIGGNGFEYSKDINLL